MLNGDKFYEKQLGIAYWYVTNKTMLKNILTVFLIVVIVILVAYNLYLLIFNFVIYQKDYQTALNDFITANSSYVALRQLSLPQAIQIGQIKAFADSQGYDLVVEIANPNQIWWATFDYQFQIGSALTDKRKGFVFPGERKNLIDLGVEQGNLASQLVLTNLNWQKEIDFVNLYREKFQFDIANVQYIAARELGVGEEIPVSRVTFEVINDSAYNYKNISFLVFLMSGDNIVGVNKIVASTLSSGEAKSLAVTFFQRLPKVTSAEIIPEINILDESVFLKF